MKNRNLAKRGLFYGFFGSLGYRLFNFSRQNIAVVVGSIIAVASLIALYRAPQNFTNGSSISLKLLTFITAPIYVIASVFTIGMAQLIFNLVYELLTNELAMEWEVMNFMFNSLDMLNEYLLQLNSFPISISNILTAYLWSLPFLVPSALIGFFKREEVTQLKNE